MSKLVTAVGAIASTTAPRIVRTPGVSGYSSRFIANHLDAPDGSILASWNSVAGAIPASLTNVGGTPAVTLGTENGIRHLYSPGGTAAGGRLLNPVHTTQRPMTIAAVFKAAGSVTDVVGMTGTTMGRSATGYYQGSSGGATLTSINHDGWVFMLVAQAADAGFSYIIRADSTEVTDPTGVTAAGSFGGIYFGSATAGQAAYVRELIYWPTQLGLSDRNKVHEYMKSRYPELP
ncbi:hypothetical protein RI444_15510 [Paenarthrobacter sp. AT5]|uniref:hypothetical protein n=1 Tax=Paenarthrobacter TaxID=1742992 RepID=UPI001A9961B2|nr:MULTISPECIES: hypothetical protein [Paenarthrobacter]QSZ53260.1 hypothetical protein AYX19_09760 [Paenarthrobacter ureafaciens]WOC59915.1 hypothetical protein RI444_15510 [Paenarthrobacter sp. AT5]